MQKLMLVAGMLVMNEMQLAAQLTFNQPYGSENDYKRLWYLNIQYIQSWVRSDTVTYNTLLWASDFVHQGGANGYLYPKKEIMPIFGQQRFAGIDYFFANNTVIQFINDDAAMVFSRPLYRDRTSAAETVSQYNDIYVKRNGNWICVSANITSVSGSNMPLPVLKEIPPPTTFVTLFSGTETDKTTIKRLNTRFREISEQGGHRQAEALLDNQFLMITSNGNVLSKEEWLQQESSALPAKPQVYSIENEYIRFVAEDIALVHGAIIYRTPAGQLSGIQFNDVYVKRGNNWKCVSSNNTPIKN